MSGPLADWIGEHAPKDASWAAVLVAKEYALAARPDGMPTHVLTPEIIKARTHVGLRTVYEGRAEALGARGWQVLVKLEHGGGRGKASRFRVVVQLCPPEAGCKACDVLQRERQKASERRTRPDDSLRHAQSKSRGRRGNSAPRAPNRAPRAPNRAPGADATGTGDGSPLQGEPSPTGGGGDARSPAPPRGGSAARLDNPQRAADAIAAYNRELEAQRPEHGVPPPKGLSDLARRPAASRIEEPT